MTTGPFRPRTSPVRTDCVHFGFPTLTGLTLRLATASNSPVRVSRRKMRPWSTFFVHRVATANYRRDLPFQAAHVCNHLVSGTFHPPFGALFIFPSPYLYAIGLETYLVLEADGFQIPAPKSGCSIQGLQLISSRFTPTGFSPSSTGRFRPLRPHQGGGSRAHNTTSPTGFPVGFSLDSALFTRRYSGNPF